ncbi:MAG: ArnT family glycosyltransferase [Limnospira sp.]
MKFADTIRRGPVQPQAGRIAAIAGLVAIAIVAFLWHLGSVGLVDETEPLFAEAARQMSVTGNWITPYFNGQTRFDKPPLIYWLMAIGYSIFGVNEWAVRLPSALSAIALMAGCFFTLRRFGVPSGDRRDLWLSAWIGSAIAALNLETLVWARQGVSDMLLSGCMGLGLLSFFWGYATTPEKQPPKPVKFGDIFHFQFPNKWYLGFYIWTGLAVLAKGPVGVVLPGLIILAFLIYVNRLFSVFREMGLIWGAIILGAITVPWYVLVILENGQTYIDSFFGYHNFKRFTRVVNGHSAPWYFYFIVVAIGFMPWSVYLPIAFSRLQFWRRSPWIRQPRFTHLKLFSFFWFSCIFLFFTVSVTKLPSYVLPLMPAAAISVAIFWTEELTQNRDFSFAKNRGFFVTVIVNICGLAMVAIAIIISPNFIGPDPAVENLPEWVRTSGLPIVGGIIWMATAVFIVWLMGDWWLRDRDRWRWILIPNFIGFILFFCLVFIPGLFLVDEARQLPLRYLSERVETVRQADEELWMLGFEKPSVVFYTQKPVRFFPIRDFFKIQSRPILYVIGSLKNDLKSDTAIAISRPKDLQKLGLQPTDYPVLAERGRYQLIRLSKQILLYRVLNDTSDS